MISEADTKATEAQAAEAIADIHVRPPLTSHPKPACWLRIGSSRHAGHLEERDDGLWAFRWAPGTPVSALRRASLAGLSLVTDAGPMKRAGAPPLQIDRFEVRTDEGCLVFAGKPSRERMGKLHVPDARVVARLTGPSLAGRVLTGELEALSARDMLLRAVDRERLLVPGAVLRVRVPTAWGMDFDIAARITGLARETTGTLLHLRVANRRSTATLGHLAVCTCNGFSAHTMWTQGLPQHPLRRLLRIRQAVTAADLEQVHRLRRDANQFYGRRPGDDDIASWADPLDRSSIVLLACLGDRAVATGRLVVNDGDRGRSELQGLVPLPDFLWEGGFAEVSRLVVHPDFQGLSIRSDMFREVASVALALGVRYLVFDAIPKLIPLYEKVGGVCLPLTKKHQDSDEIETVMYLDIRSILTTFNLKSILLLIAFRSALARHVRMSGADSLTPITGPRPNLLVRLYRAVALRMLR
jgi:GNAT superfamily N-acetyltransferase